MAVGRTLAVALSGLDGALVDVEADITSQLPGFVLIGLPDAALSQARERVRAATGNAGSSSPSAGSPSTSRRPSCRSTAPASTSR